MIIRFWLLDINYDLVGGIPEIRLWGIDDKGKRVVILERNFRPYVYILPINEQFLKKITEEIDKLRNKYKILEIDVAEKKYFGKILKVLKVTLLNPRNVPRFREDLSKIRGIKEVLEADIRFYMRYMIDNDIYPSAWHDVEVEEVSNKNRWDVDHVYIAKKTPIFVSYENPPDLRIFAFDIECYNVLGEPNPLRDPVIIIATLNKNKEIKIFQARDKDDEELIKNFIKDIKEYDPDIIVGYNSNRFDWPYLRERTKHLKIRLDVSRAGGQPTQSVYGHFSIVGRANIDLFDFAEEINEVKVKTLENIADYLGVKKKNERVLIEGAFIYEYWDKLEKRKILVEYSKDDVESTYGLAEKFLPFAIQLSNIVGLPLDQVGSASVGYRVEWHLMRQAYKFNELIPNRIERPYETYKGAIVLKPKPGIHKNVAVLDFSSMYPNIMIQKNISPDTYVPPYEKIDESKVYIAPEVGHRFLKNPPGFYKKILERLLKARKEIRNKMKKLDPSNIEYRILDERQKALKIIANATYGYCGWSNARWYKREIAEATTAWGRKLIKDTINFAKKIGLEIIYGDTDSIFAYYDKEKIEKLIKYVEKDLGFDIKIDKVYKKVFFTEAKKRYCGLLEDGRIDVVGLEAVRGDWTDLAKEVQEKVIEIILTKENPYDAVEYVRHIIKDFKEGKIPLYKLIIWKSLTKHISEYAVETAHVAAAKQLIQMGYKISKGEKIGFVVCKGGGEKLSSKSKPYILIKDQSEIDEEYYINKQIIPAALRILSYFGIREDNFISTERQSSLLDFFQ